MPDKSLTSTQGRSGEGGNVLPALCSVLGTLLLAIAVVLIVPLALPPLFGNPPYELDTPLIGSFLPIFETVAGKVYLALIAACGVMLLMLAGHLRTKHTPRRWAAKAARITVVTILSVVFVGSAGVIVYTNWQYYISDMLYSNARNSFTNEDVDLSGLLSVVADKAPITVDFASLQSQYPDVVGWLYCAGTPINYPIVQTDNNDYYLSHDYTGDFNINGAIFVSKDDKLAVDSKAIIYGHHMQSGSMFASLLDWSNQGFYDEHPIMWLLTPTQNYRVDLFSGHHTNAYSNMYASVHEVGDELRAYLDNAKSLSDFESQVKLDYKGHYIMLSTCAYLFDDDRYVLHGMLVPVM